MKSGGRGVTFSESAAGGQVPPLEEIMSDPSPATAVVPNLLVDAIEPVRDFYLEKLGFQHMMGMVGRDGRLDFCIVMREGAMIMLTRPLERIEGSAPGYPTPRPVEIYFPASDVGRYHDQVRAAGVPISDPLTTQWWGDRNFAVRDPHGYRLWFYENVEDFESLVRAGKVPEGVKLI
jgi:uncharacterized glyoxalase superfamily protein PhnB